MSLSICLPLSPFPSVPQLSLSVCVPPSLCRFAKPLFDFRFILLACILLTQLVGCVLGHSDTTTTTTNNNNRIQRRYSRFFTTSHSKALFEIFYNLLTAPRTVSNTYTQVARAQSCANHVQHIQRLSCASVMLRATWYEGTAQLLSLTELKSHLFELLFYWLNH